MPITAGDFFNALGPGANLVLVEGRLGLARRIHEPAIHRPGLALAGYVKHFARRRVQVIGLAEHEYLADLPAERRMAVLRNLFRQPIPCLVLCRNRRPCAEMAALARDRRVALFRTPMVTGPFINRATVMLEHLFAPTLSVQGTLVDIKGIGVLIEGPPAIGKSEAALALVMRGYSLVADDFVVLRRHEGQAVLGTSSPATRYHMELRGLGIVHIPSLYGVNAVVEEKRLDLIVTLRPAGEVPDPPAPSERQVLGVSVPQVTIPVSPGRDLAPIIELAGMNERLKRLGHDAAKELDEKLVTAMMERMSGS